MSDRPAKISLEEWDARQGALGARSGGGIRYGGPLGRHVVERGDLRLRHLRFDNSAAALRLWNLVLTEEDRLRAHRERGCKLVGTMKDLGTVPVLAYALPNLVAFYPDGAWWTPCFMECSDGLFQVADRLGINESFCPVRAMLGAFVTRAHFPLPDFLVCSVGAVCDDFTAIAQRLESLGHPIFWWEMPRRRRPDPDEAAVVLPGGMVAPRIQVELVREELARVRRALEALAGRPLDDVTLAEGIRQANAVRRRITRLRQTVSEASVCPLPALEMLLVDALAIHYCSDRAETIAVLDELQAEVNRRVARGEGVLSPEAVRLYWVNPVADLRLMNLVEEWGGRICGADYLFGHAMVEIPEELPPMEALAQVALADPMVGSAGDRAGQVASEVLGLGIEGLVVARIPGASHCAHEGAWVREEVARRAALPAVELEVPPLCDGLEAALRSRLQALLETVQSRRAT